jgi:hypothetical protein
MLKPRFGAEEIHLQTVFSSLSLAKIMPATFKKAREPNRSAPNVADQSRAEGKD